MPTPDFILELRAHIGHAPLWMIGITAVVIRDDEVLLIERADNGAWTPVTGIVEPGENPADTAVREVAEEAGVVAVPRRLAWVHVTDPVVHANGDHAQYLDHVFRMDWVSGDPHPADDECSAAGWYSLDALPELSERMRLRIKAALEAGLETRFDQAPKP
ncbi:NUDIX hydrolase [Jongsikchunia kroppenstedtii]|uniref:NUDIX hydrolase n=1 Tax=Jongsikchunia kroppenstedtii TaxID=1121721 RepID=UPI0003781F76|nr:NUDIX domain-containing protein [Jongsikchunia kroppenstedtii]